MTQKRPFILITNDDGIHATGIKHLYNSVCEFADVAICAPQVEKSGAGLSITWKKPLHIHEVPWENNVPAWSVSGTPADCIKMALAVLLNRKPDIIISGVNKGSNAGRTVLYSGTIGGTIEGALKGIPGIAFSFCDYQDPPLEATRPYIVPIISHFLRNPMEHGTIINVNFPPNAKDGIKGFRMAKQGKSYWKESPDKRIHPEGLTYYWLGGAWKPADEELESDVALLEAGYVTASPIQVAHMTCYKTMNAQKESLEKALNAEALQRPLENSR